MQLTEPSEMPCTAGDSGQLLPQRSKMLSHRGPRLEREGVPIHDRTASPGRCLPASPRDGSAAGAANPGAAATDSGSLPNLKFPIAAVRNRLHTGGWAREAMTP